MRWKRVQSKEENCGGFDSRLHWRKLAVSPIHQGDHFWDAAGMKAMTGMSGR
ncbi:hypothetical protein BN77_1652 [Rhizobium mesoamericanum STM3625]|uniref:Uncharacterized protein n=1 Tax=Rhizobium mesoamericanum STM3625 TaxID=1211777 RepID=K0PT28_9HYPH|nr:hypothetical protein BN77_1652 [Rhizobium mesoamericanum STM3625]